MVKSILILILVLFGVGFVGLLLPPLLAAPPGESSLSSLTTVSPTVYQLAEVPLSSPTQTILSDTGCTYPEEYWLQNPQAIPAEIVINNRAISQEQGLWLVQNSTSTAEILVRQLYIVYLNIAGGASPARIHAYVTQAETWLSMYQADEPISNFQHQNGLALADVLAAYNSGEFGPGLCQTQSAAVVPTTTASPTPMPSATPRRRSTSTPGSDDGGGDHTPTSSPVPPTATSTPLIPTQPTHTPTPAEARTVTVPPPTMIWEPYTATLLPTATAPTQSSGHMGMPKN